MQAVNLMSVVKQAGPEINKSKYCHYEIGKIPNNKFAKGRKTTKVQL